MNCRVALAIIFLSATLCCAVAQPSDPQTAKEALQELQDFVGGWKGNGTSERDKTAIWKEAMSWGWRFKGADSWLVLEVKDSKFYKSGELRYLADKKVYQLTLVDKADKTLIFLGSLNKTNLILERVDPATKETQQLKFNSAGGGDRLVATYSVMPENRKVYSKEWQIGMTREGVALAAGKKNPECIVTGGLGTITVAYKDTTYYVCCGGCRDAFKEEPEKFIKEWKDKKKAGK